MRGTNKISKKSTANGGAGNTRRHGVLVGECKNCSQRNVPRKPSKVILFREIVERIRCPEGSQKEAKKAFTDWHLSFHVLPQKWALAILGPREKTTPTKTQRWLFTNKSQKYRKTSSERNDPKKNLPPTMNDKVTQIRNPHLVVDRQASFTGKRRARAKSVC